MRLLFFATLLAWFMFSACTPDPAVRVLTEERNVYNVLINLFVETDNRSWEKVKSCFADEVLFDMTSLAGGEATKMTPQKIVDGWDAGFRSLTAIHHQVGNLRIEIDGNQARAFCYGIASHYLPNSSGNNTRTFVGSYDFHLVQTGTSWKIDEFTFNSKYVTGNLTLESSNQ